MNGEPIAEPDFVQMHVSILYAERGLKLKHDAYETGEFSRELGKLALNVVLNAKSLQGVIAALRNKPDWPLLDADTRRLIEALKRRNAPIADAFHSDQGVRLCASTARLSCAS